VVQDAAVETSRREWEESNRLLEAEARDRARYVRLVEQVEAVTAELRKRVGQTFTLAELADEYVRAERWSRDAVAGTAPPPGWPRTLTVVEGAAFHLYARGAVDYSP
jgi:hypothetical protein